MKPTEILSIYAALLSTIVFLWNIIRAIPRYKVDIAFAVHEENGECKHGVYISIRNPSPHTVHLAGIDILYPYRESTLKERVEHVVKYRQTPKTVGWVHSSLSNYDLDDQCPLALESGKSKNIFIPHEALEKILDDCTTREIIACVQDQLWRNKHSKKFNYPETKEQ